MGPRLQPSPEGLMLGGGGSTADEKEQRKRPLSPTRGRNSRMFPVRFPSMICQWNRSWIENTSRRPCRLPYPHPILPRCGEHGPSEKHSLSSTYHL